MMNLGSPAEVRAFFHTTKGRVVGKVLSQDDTWTRIELVEDAWADVRHRHRDPAGSVRSYRTSRLVEIKVPA